jgi:hypothetical protein
MALLITSCATYAKDAAKPNSPPIKQERASPSDIVDFEGKLIPADDFEPVPESDPSFYVVLDKDSEIFRSTATQDSTGTMMPNIPAWVKENILKHEQTNPTPFTLNAAELGECQFLGIKLLLDNRKSTEDWGISTAKPCNWKVIPPRGNIDASRATIWIVRKQGDNTKVLSTGRGMSFAAGGIEEAGQESRAAFKSYWLYPNNAFALSSVSFNWLENGKEVRTGLANYQVCGDAMGVTSNQCGERIDRHYIDDDGVPVFVPWKEPK